MIRRDDIFRLFRAAEIGLDGSDLDDDKPLAAQGLDSLDLANLLFQIEQTYGLTISPEDASRLRSVRDMVDYVGARK
ncbi:phosphopantetheine-binding protein [Pendulispora brunnea]|uniref:Phosphopantetheine-binding protein n=1 Tax=Pendulispora brunnea TaxID=2905690 RepID=A0ABZ2K0J0_9BACT